MYLHNLDVLNAMEKVEEALYAMHAAESDKADKDMIEYNKTKKKN